MNKTKVSKILKIGVLIYAISFLAINWNDVSWIFNYKQVYGMVEDFFNPYPGIDALAMDAYFYPNHSSSQIQTQASQHTSQPVTQNTEAKTNYTEKQNHIEIPKISITAPIIFSQSTDTSILMKDLDKGVVYYPGSVYPGQQGQIIILGHSAPVGWPKIKHDWVFSDLNNLEAGDKILIDLNNKQYTYIVKQKTIIAKGAEVPAYTSPNGVLTLISCWPPGKDYQRIAVQAELLTTN
jgi:sortase A